MTQPVDQKLFDIIVDCYPGPYLPRWVKVAMTRMFFKVDPEAHRRRIEAFSEA